MRRRLTCIVIGAGMSGILAAIRLRERGDDVIVLEKGATVGGTWRENRYAGLTCDVPAHAYTYSFAPNPAWSRYFATGSEIQEYFEGVVDRCGVREAIRFGVEVAEAAWQNGKWHVEAKDGSRYEADVLIAATGVLHHPRYPDIKGMDTFSGQAFHSARWPDQIDLAGKRVGVIGNGSTGVQIVSALAGVAAHVDHFQRSPQWIMPVQDFAYSEEERARFRADPAAIDAIRFDPEYVGNVRRFNNAIIDPASEAMAFIESIVRQNLEASIADPVLREKLTPDYRAACKRLIYSPSYYAQVQRDDVDVVRAGIEAIEPEGVRTRDGALHGCDVIVYATGFHADRFVRPINIVGRDGIALNDVWARRPSAFLAISVPDMPNLFMLNGPTGPVGNFSLIEIAEAQWGYIAQLIQRIESGEADEISPTHAAMASYEERRIAAAKTTIFASGCSSWYLDAEGVPQSWPWSYDRFFEEMRAPELSAYDVRTHVRAPT
ncbi:flavin-containing monooxygenase [Sphingomonas sp. TDK1]|uniref:flavin-containing monooxygenase n=1 Tax=Sphingomonas sp. TDK1 TaxID=453247 RepID=UPI0007D9B349|nr:NAD(P)/FAD-dependent oxidoreductase [Sphingomonas sp. TDK1]OAN66663.1 monooxygenase [Sphingomonas sp. TDK1]